MPTRLSRAEQQEQTRQRLLDAALGTFRKRGFAAATVDEIAELAGHTRGAFYWHFGSKEALFLQTLEELLPQELEQLRVAVVRARSESGVIRVLLSFVVPAGEEAKLQLRDTADLWARLTENPEMRASALRVQEQLEDFLGWCAEEICRRRGGALSVPARQVGLLMAALLEGLTSRLLVDPGTDVEGELSRGLLALIDAAAAVREL